MNLGGQRVGSELGGNWKREKIQILEIILYI